MNFPTQKKILEPILKSAKNNHCADCNATSPTWASLDFGVFLCSNCAGGHRALGPTVTRIKSATLDLWQEEWIDNMLIGNEVLNAYWEGDSRCYQKKPKWGATNQDIARYVYEKYVKRRYVREPSKPDPLTIYKQTKRIPDVSFAYQQKTQSRKPIVHTTKVQIQQAPVVIVRNVNKNHDLIDFTFETGPVSPQVQAHTLTHSIGQQRIPTTHLNHQIDRPGIQPIEVERTETNRTEHGTSFTSSNSGQNFISFDQMMNTHKSNSNAQPPLIHSLSSQHVHRPTFTIPHIQTHNLPINHLNEHQQYNYHNHLYPQSPQPQINHYGQPNNYGQFQAQNMRNQFGYQHNPTFWH